MIFWTVASLFLGAVGLDVGSTLYVYPRCQPCVETNPLARPFVERPTLLISGAVILSGGVVLGSWELKQHKSRWWYVVPVIATAWHLAAARHNFHQLGAPE